MKGRLIAVIAGLGAACGLALIAPAWAAAPKAKAHAHTATSPSRPIFRNVSVSLPQDFDLEYPAGAGVEAVNANCRACHSTSMVLTQPPLSAEEWHKEVRKMIDTYKAPIPEDQVEPITRYLATLSKAQAR